jgi:hypothetical protein
VSGSCLLYITWLIDSKDSILGITSVYSDVLVPFMNPLHYDLIWSSSACKLTHASESRYRNLAILKHLTTTGYNMLNSPKMPNNRFIRDTKAANWFEQEGTKKTKYCGTAHAWATPTLSVFISAAEVLRCRLSEAHLRLDIVAWNNTFICCWGCTFTFFEQSSRYYGKVFV